MATERNCQGIARWKDRHRNLLKHHPIEPPVCRRSRGQPMLGDWGAARLPSVYRIMLTVKELSAWLNIAVHTLSLGLTEQDSCRRIHGLVRFEPEAIQAWLKGFLSTSSSQSSSSAPASYRRRRPPH